MRDSDDYLDTFAFTHDLRFCDFHERAAIDELPAPYSLSAIDAISWALSIDERRASMCNWPSFGYVFS